MTRRINYETRCEFGALSRSIDILADKTGELLSQINAGSRHLVNESSRSAEISESAMTRVQEQRSQTDQVAAAITELEVSATEVARSTDGAKDEVDHADAEAKQGRQRSPRHVVLPSSWRVIWNRPWALPINSASLVVTLAVFCM